MTQASTDKNFTGLDFVNKVDGFSEPTARPSTAEQHAKWQEANKSWWTSTPMRYDWRGEIPFEVHSKEYFDEVDDRFFESSRPYMPWKNLPFEKEIPFDHLSQMDVLEIGVGQGSHASLIAPRAKSFTGIDLTAPAVESTTKRMALMKLKNATVKQMDAEKMDFANASFDYIWTWGVIHHSADTRQIIQQMARVLREGGQANVMVYHRSFWKYYIHDGFFKGVLQGGLFKGRGVTGINQAATDGAIARYYTKSEWRKLVSDLFDVDSFAITGLKVELLPLPPGKIKNGLEKVIPNFISRFFTNTLSWGSFLTIRMTKK